MVMFRIAATAITLFEDVPNSQNYAVRIALCYSRVLASPPTMETRVRFSAETWDLQFRMKMTLVKFLHILNK
jgi:hypothetical protein